MAINQSSNRHSVFRASPAPDANLSSTEDDHQKWSTIRSMEASENKYVMHGLKPLTHTMTRVVGNEILEPEIVPSFNHHQGLGSPLILSPTQSDSVASSPGSENDIWDPPETPLVRSGGVFATDSLTPLTPPTTYTKSSDRSPSFKGLKSLRARTVRGVSTTDTVTTHSAAPVAFEREDSNVEVEDYFQPKKLFRNLTKELQAISNGNALAAQGNYRLRPTFDFESLPGSISDTSSRTTNVQTRYNLRRDISNPVLEVHRTDTSVTANVVSRTGTLSKKLQELEHIVPSDVRTRLEHLPTKCVASLVREPEKRCAVNGPSQSTDDIFREIWSCNVDINGAKFLHCIQQLVEATQCGSHRNVAYRRIETFKDIASDPSKLSKKDQLDFRAWIDAISARTTHATLQNFSDQVLLENETHIKIEVLDRKLASSRTKADPTSSKLAPSISGFASYQPMWSKSLDVSSALRKIITKPLSSTDLKSGFIYVFWDKAHFGKVKIGHTNDLKRRLKEWDDKCARTHQYHPSSKRELIEIPHVSRIERLMHIELKNCRKERKCENCNTTHREWFDVEETSAVKVFLKWKSWIEQRPYALNKESEQWEIRPEMEDTLEAICQPVVLDKEERTPPRPRIGKKSKRVSRHAAVGRDRESLPSR